MKMMKGAETVQSNGREKEQYFLYEKDQKMLKTTRLYEGRYFLNYNVLKGDIFRWWCFSDFQ